MTFMQMIYKGNVLVILAYGHLILVLGRTARQRVWQNKVTHFLNGNHNAKTDKGRVWEQDICPMDMHQLYTSTSNFPSPQ